MTSAEFRDRLSERARRVGLSIAEPAQQQLEEYFRLLAHWNSKVNLTSLALQNRTDEAFDRLLIEPVAAAGYFPDLAKSWMDLGSGGGSPAIPIKILRPAVSLTMVEARVRKAAFLREAVRVLQLSDTVVENSRFEALGPRTELHHRFDVVTVRGVRADENLFAVTQLLLDNRGQGRLLMFQSQAVSLANSAEFRLVGRFRLLNDRPSYLVSLAPVIGFHVEQSG